MTKHNQDGAIGIGALVAVVMSVLFIAASVFGLWAFMGRQDYKNNVDEKIETAVESAKEETETAKEAEFAERDKSPTKVFHAAESFGALTFSYPRTWSAYVENSGGETPINATFHPDFVGNDKDVAFALRLQVVNTTYDQALKAYDSEIKKGTVTASPFTPKLVASALGVRLSGEIVSKKTGVMILLPLRDKTIKIWTESNNFVGDLDKFILESLSYQP